MALTEQDRDILDSCDDEQQFIVDAMFRLSDEQILAHPIVRRLMDERDLAARERTKRKVSSLYGQVLGIRNDAEALLREMERAYILNDFSVPAAKEQNNGHTERST